jgi:hypothetical protein
METTNTPKKKIGIKGIIFPLIALVLTAVTLALTFISIKESYSNSGYSLSATFNASFFTLSGTGSFSGQSASWFSSSTPSHFTSTMIIFALVFVILAILMYLIQLVLNVVRGSKSGKIAILFPILGIVFSIITIITFYIGIDHLLSKIPSPASVSSYPSYGMYILIVGIIFGIISIFLKD